MSLPEIKGFLETSFTDWPGKVVSVVFLPGCNLRCPYCHNHKLVNDPDSLKEWPLEFVTSRLENFRGWIDGVCVTGGEPTVNPGLIELLELFAKLKWPVKLDTNGTKPDVVEEVTERGLATAFSVDLKAPLEDIPYMKNSGIPVEVELVERSVGLIVDSGLWFELRTTVHPGLITLEEVERLARQAARLTGGEGEFKLQQCRVDEVLAPSLQGSETLSDELFAEWSSVAGKAYRDEAGKY